MKTPPDVQAARRAAIEEELRQRLASDSATTRQGVHALVALLCAACEGLSSGDAHFCTHCGTRFNARVVPADMADRGSSA